MPHADKSRCRLTLVTPPSVDIPEFAPRLEAAFAGGDVASLIITANTPDTLAGVAEALTPIAQAAGVAALIHNDTRIAARAGADGVHIDTDIADLKAAQAAFHPDRIVGAGNAHSRHEAMTIGGADPDYLFLGRLDGDTEDGIFPPALDLATWWSALFVIPAIVMGGRQLTSVTQAAKAGIEFVALCDAVWASPDGPGAAVAEANRLLSAVEEHAA